MVESQRRQIGLIVGCLGMALLFVAAFQMAFVGTCTPKTNFYGASLIFCGVITAFVCLLISMWDTGAVAAVVRVAVSAVVVIGVAIRLPHAYATHVEGHHLCGEAFNNHLEAGLAPVEQTVFWPVQVLFVVSILGFSAGPWLKVR